MVEVRKISTTRLTFIDKFGNKQYDDPGTWLNLKTVFYNTIFSLLEPHGVKNVGDCEFEINGEKFKISNNDYTLRLLLYDKGTKRFESSLCETSIGNNEYTCWVYISIFKSKNGNIKIALHYSSDNANLTDNRFLIEINYMKDTLSGKKELILGFTYAGNTFPNGGLVNGVPWKYYSCLAAANTLTPIYTDKILLAPLGMSKDGQVALKEVQDMYTIIGVPVTALQQYTINGERYICLASNILEKL